VAALGAVGAWILVALAIYSKIGGSVPERPWNLLFIVACIALVLSCLLWFVVILEYVRERPERYPYLACSGVLWAGNWPAAFLSPGLASEIRQA
jgi:hypothetical protein